MEVEDLEISTKIQMLDLFVCSGGAGQEMEVEVVMATLSNQVVLDCCYWIMDAGVGVDVSAGECVDEDADECVDEYFGDSQSAKSQDFNQVIIIIQRLIKEVDQMHPFVLELIQHCHPSAIQSDFGSNLLYCSSNRELVVNPIDLVRSRITLECRHIIILENTPLPN